MSAVVHGLLAVASSQDFIVEGSRGDLPTRAFTVLGPDGRLSGAVYGPLNQTEAGVLVGALMRRVGNAGPDVPWLAVSRLDNGEVCASASMMLPSGVFWALNAGVLVVGTDPRSVAMRAGLPLSVDPDYVRSFSNMDVAPEASPYRGVIRVPAGHLIRWSRHDAMPVITQWCGPSSWGDPWLSGPSAMDAYLATIDEVASDLATRSASVVSTVSGGLDSTFVTATLAMLANPGNPVLGLTYRPLPAANLTGGSGYDADESDLAILLSARYPHSLDVRTIANEAHVRPLAAGLANSIRSGLPTMNPGNQVWLNAMRTIATERGARMWFLGQNGNAAFSHEHEYAAAFAVQRHRVGELAELGRKEGGHLSIRLLRRRVLGPLRRQYLRHAASYRHPLAEFGLVDARTSAHFGREEYLTWLSHNDSGLAALSNPAAHEGVLAVDLFNSRAVLEVAASITPAEWQRGEASRGFARRASAGRVPDEIRLRTRRGQQGRDAWYVIRNDRNDYLDRVASLGHVAGLEHVAYKALGAHIESWPWGQEQGPNWAEHVAVDRLLALAEFAS